MEAKTVWCLVARCIETGLVQRFGPEDILQGYKYLLTARLLVGHNCRMYDIPVLERLVGLPNGLPLLPRSLDTQLCSRLLFSDPGTNPVRGHALGDWGVFLKCPKLEHADWSRFSEEMMTYCEGDVTVGEKIYRWQLPRLSRFKQAVRLEHDVASIIVKQIQNGYTLDVKAVEKLQQVLQEEKAAINDELNKVFPPKIEEMKTPAYWQLVVGDDADVLFKGSTKGQCADWWKRNKRDYGTDIEWAIVPGPNKTKSIPFNPGSGDQIADRLMAFGWKPKVFTKSGKVCTDGDVLESITIPEAQGLQRHRLLVDREGDVQGWLNHLAPDGRVHGSVITNGCVTGRMSHAKPNMNVPKNTSDFGKQMRACWVPRKGWTQVGIDAKSLEARMSANRQWKYDGGAYAKVVLEGDIHEMNRQILGLDTGDPKKDRDDTKTWYYAWSYGAYDKKLGSIICKPGASEKEQTRLGAESRAKFAKGLESLTRVINDCKFLVNKQKYIPTLDGRHIPTRSEHAALNTQLQSDGAIVMKQALVLFYAAMVEQFGPHGGRWAFLVNVHDEFQIECEPEIAEAVGKLGAESITKAGILLGVKVRLDGDYKIGANWAEAH